MSGGTIEASMSHSHHSAVDAGVDESTSGHGLSKVWKAVRGPSKKDRERGESLLKVEADTRAAKNVDRIKNLTDDEARQLYDEVGTNVRTTDEISFKLLGFVPLVSGGAITVLLSTNTSFSSLPILVYVGLFGAVVTFGLFRWELKNIEVCHWLTDLGREIEEHQFGLTEGQFLERPHPRRFLGRWDLEKPQSEKLIYGAAIVAWLLLPVVAAIAAAID